MNHAYRFSEQAGDVARKGLLPQGSILCPPLFIAYISNIFNIPYNAKPVTYADDTSLFLAGTNSDDMIYAANTLMSYVKLWVDNNCLKNNTTTNTSKE